MKDERGLYYHPQAGNNQASVYVRRGPDGEVEFRRWQADHPEIWGRHQALRSFLIDDLGIDPEVADKEACMMEHAISEHTMSRWLLWLDELHAAEKTSA